MTSATYQIKKVDEATGSSEILPKKYKSFSMARWQRSEMTIDNKGYKFRVIKI